MNSDIFSNLLETAPSLGISLFALWVVSKKLWTAQEQHLNAYRDRIKALEKHTDDCNRDREELHKQHAALQSEVIGKLAELVEKR